MYWNKLDAEVNNARNIYDFKSKLDNSKRKYIYKRKNEHNSDTNIDHSLQNNIAEIFTMQYNTRSIN